MEAEEQIGAGTNSIVDTPAAVSAGSQADSPVPGSHRGVGLPGPFGTTGANPSPSAVSDSATGSASHGDTVAEPAHMIPPTESSVVSPEIADSATAPQRPKTRSQSGISKPKTYTDGTVRYSMLTSTGEPRDVHEALGDDRWLKAMEEELGALHKNNTWHLVPQQQGINLIDCKWVFKVKRKSDGSVDRYKARLVAKGFKQ